MPEPTPLEVFCSYAPEDDGLRKDLALRLKPLELKKLIACWHEAQVLPGEDRQQQIDAHLDRAPLIVLLISPSYLGSEVCRAQMGRALTRQQDREARVVPILLEACLWEDESAAKLQVLPRDGQPVASHDRDSRGQVWVDIAAAIQGVAAELNRDQVESFASYTRRWGVFEGVGPPLTAEQVAQRQSSIRLTRRAGKLLSAEIINRHGQRAEHADGSLNTELSSQNRGGQGNGQYNGQSGAECRWLFIRDAQDNLSHVQVEDRAGRLLYVLKYAPSRDRREVVVHYESQGGYPLAMAGSGASSMEIRRDDQGRDVEVRYYDKGHNPQPDEQGSYGELREFDERGLPTLFTNLGYDGKPAFRKDGYARGRLRYDEKGRCIAAECLGLDDSLALKDEGFASLSFAFDAWGNRNKTFYWDDDGRTPVRCKQGYAVATIDYDGAGNSTQTYYDDKGARTSSVDGYSRCRVIYNDKGLPTRVEFSDEHDQPVRSGEGYARWTASYDDRGNRVELCFWDEQPDNNQGSGQPALAVAGFARARMDLDEQGRVRVLTYFDEHGACRHRDGYAKERLSYDDQGNILSTTFLAEDGQSEVLAAPGYSGTRASYDDSGKQLALTYCAFGQPVRCRLGYSTWLCEYDPRGNLIRETYLDESRAGATIDASWAGNHHSATFTKDASGQIAQSDSKPESKNDSAAPSPQNPMIPVSLLSPQRKLVRHPVKGYAERKAFFNEAGRQTNEAYLGADGKAAVGAAGYAEWKAKYDPRGQRVEQSFFDGDGKEVRIAAGYSRWTAEYGKRWVRRTFRDLQRKPVRLPEGYTTLITHYDWRGNVVALSYEDQPVDDQPGRPVRHRDGHLSETRTYNDRGVPVALTFAGFTPDHGFDQMIVQLDGRGRVKRESYHDEQGRPVLDPRGIAAWTAEYDPDGNQIARCNYGLSGQLTPDENGVARWTARHDGHRAPVAVAYFDEHGGPVSDRHTGFARLSRTFDENGNSVVALFDARGLVLQVSCHDAQGRPALHEEGWSLWVAQHAEDGTRLGEAYRGPDGRPVRLPQGYASWALRPQPGQPAEVVFFDENMKQVQPQADSGAKP